MQQQQQIAELKAKLKTIESQLSNAGKAEVEKLESKLAPKLQQMETVSFEQRGLIEKLADLRTAIKAAVPDEIESKLRGRIIQEVMGRVESLLERKGIDKDEVIAKAKEIFAAIPKEWQEKLMPLINEIRLIKAQMERDLKANETSLVETAKTSAKGAVKELVISAVKEHAENSPLASLGLYILSGLLGGGGLLGVGQAVAGWFARRRDTVQVLDNQGAA
jgi:regulator of replication initiation timing